jgi:hypothetical protein
MAEARPAPTAPPAADGSATTNAEAKLKFANDGSFVERFRAMQAAKAAAEEAEKQRQQAEQQQQQKQQQQQQQQQEHSATAADADGKRTAQRVSHKPGA